MKGQDILKYALIAVAAYLLYKYAVEQGWLGAPELPGLPPTPGGQPQLQPPAVQPPAQPPTQPPAQPPAATTKDRVGQAARAAGYAGTLTFDQWNYFYGQVAARPGPAIEDAFPGVPRETQMTLDQWWAGVSGAGFSGLARWPLMSAWAN